MKDKGVEEYLNKVKFYLTGISGKEKKKILAELNAELIDLAKDGGFENVIKEFGNPKDLALKYKKIYGYSAEFKVLLILFGAILSFFTIPLESNLKMVMFSTIILAIVFVYLGYVSLNISGNLGLLTGIFSAISRGVAFMLMPFTIDAIDILIFITVSIIIIVAGFIPGYLIKIKEESEEV